jgi:uncharacterized protein (TIGR02271 family)
MQQTITSATKTLVAVYKDQETARQAVQALAAEGFPREHINVTAGRDATTTTNTQDRGGIVGFFKNMFGADVDDRDGNRYNSLLGEGRVLVSVPVSDHEMSHAEHILDRYDPIDIDSDRSINTQGQMDGRDQTGGSIPVVEEEIRVGRRSVQRGGVRIHSRVVEKPVEEQVELREEHVRVDRRPVDRAATEADIRNAERSFEVAETIEEPVIGKQMRVREEVVINKEATTRQENVRDTVRHTEVDVQPIGNESRTASRDYKDFDADYRSDFNTRYGTTQGADYQNYAPAYRFGSEFADDRRYSGRSWEEIENDARNQYMQTNPGSNWEKLKDAVRYGWNKRSNRI